MKTVFLLLTLGLSVGAYAQSLSAQEKATTVDSLEAKLMRMYVYPEVAEKMVTAVRDKHASGGYDAITDGRQFAQTLTEDLIGVSHDLHIGVRYDPEGIAEFAQSQYSPEEEEAYRARELARARANNFNLVELKILPGNVGYFKLNGFSGWEEGKQKAMHAMQWLGDANAIIFDLRDNGGGDPEMVQVISSYLFEGVEHLNTFYWRPTDDYRYFYTLPAVLGQRMPEVPVYVLTSGGTFSAAEEFTYNLKNMERATIVGETTGGGAHPGGPVAITDKLMMFLPQGRAINPITETNWEGTGIEPHIAVPAAEALDVAHLAALKVLREQHTEPGPVSEQLDWVIAEMEVLQNPVEVHRNVLAKYVGNYGPQRLTLNEDGLYYSRDNRRPRKMIPMSEDTFMVEGVDGFRIKLVREGNKTVALEGQYMGGRTDRNERQSE